MPLIALAAHYDGERICLDENFDIKPDTRLIVTILPEKISDIERENWLNLSDKTLSNAYGDDEPEYSINSIKEVNPYYETR